MTRVAGTQVQDVDFAAVSAVFSARKVADLAAAVAVMSACNRFGGGFRLVPKAVAAA